MVMTPEERDELLDEALSEPLPPLQELIDKWIKPDGYLPSEEPDDGPFDVVGPELVPEEEEEPLVASGDLRARLAQASTRLTGKG